mgnify:CR=1 FL=1
MPTSIVARVPSAASNSQVGHVVPFAGVLPRETRFPLAEREAYIVLVSRLFRQAERNLNRVAASIRLAFGGCYRFVTLAVREPCEN